jgi:hypothetical protein
MVVYNPITGLRRRMPHNMTARKKRKTTSSTVAQRMFAADAMDSYFCYILGHKKALFFVAILTAMEFNFQSSEGEYMGNFLVMAAAIFAQKAACMLRFDSELMDLRDHDLVHSGYNKDLVDLTLDHYANDDECENSTRFSKEEILILLDFLGFGDGQGYIRVYYNGHVYYKYRAVTLFIYMLRKMSTGRTHKDLADTEFGGTSGQWGVGYNWLVKYMDKRTDPLIGPTALELWAP